MDEAASRMAAWAIGLVSIALMLAALLLKFVDRRATLPEVGDAWTLSNAFDIVVHTQGVRRDSVFPDGHVVTILHDFSVTYTNPATGKSVRSVLAGPEQVDSNPDGTITVIVDGNNGLFTIPGQGIVFGDVGRYVYVADPDDPFTPLRVIQQSGRQDATPFPAVCSGLS